MIITNDMMVHKALSDKIDGYKNCDVVKRNQLKEKWLHDVNFNLVFIKHKRWRTASNLEGMELWNKITRLHYHPYSFVLIGPSHASMESATY